MAIIVYNRRKEDHSNNPNNYPIYRGGSILGNPYIDKPLKRTLAIYQVKDRNEALSRYNSYFDLQYAHNAQFKAIIDEIYGKYKNGEDIFLECYCSNENECHGGVIKQKLEKRRIKEEILKIKKKQNAK